MPMNVHNSPHLFLLFPFTNGGGTVEIGKLFVQIKETAVPWRIAYLGEERRSLEAFKIVLLLYLCYSS